MESTQRHSTLLSKDNFYLRLHTLEKALGILTGLHILYDTPCGLQRRASQHSP